MFFLATGRSTVCRRRYSMIFPAPPKQKTAYVIIIIRRSPLLDKVLPRVSPQGPVPGFSHPVGSCDFYQVVSLPCMGVYRCSAFRYTVATSELFLYRRPSSSSSSTARLHPLLGTGLSFFVSISRESRGYLLRF